MPVSAGLACDITQRRALTAQCLQTPRQSPFSCPITNSSVEYLTSPRIPLSSFFQPPRIAYASPASLHPHSPSRKHTDRCLCCHGPWPRTCHLFATLTISRPAAVSRFPSELAFQNTPSRRSALNLNPGTGSLLTSLVTSKGKPPLVRRPQLSHLRSRPSARHGIDTDTSLSYSLVGEPHLVALLRRPFFWPPHITVAVALQL